MTAGCDFDLSLSVHKLVISIQGQGVLCCNVQCGTSFSRKTIPHPTSIGKNNLANNKYLSCAALICVIIGYWCWVS